MFLLLLNEKYLFDGRKQDFKKHKILLLHIKISEQILIFGNIEADKINFTTILKSHFFKAFRY